MIFSINPVSLWVVQPQKSVPFPFTFVHSKWMPARPMPPATITGAWPGSMVKPLPRGPRTMTFSPRPKAASADVPFPATR